MVETWHIRSHWEKRLLMNEIMTGSVDTRSVVSKMTLALLEDSGCCFIQSKKPSSRYSNHRELSAFPPSFQRERSSYRTQRRRCANPKLSESFHALSSETEVPFSLYIYISRNIVNRGQCYRLRRRVRFVPLSLSSARSFSGMHRSERLSSAPIEESPAV
ncbi:hypothetical protein VNO80_02252 [Phaseolus coccineus]|uniref:Uncharacterized protein n=1 Tax=Phaseolus coccineus TaxID=3886 RepID=A0AAN9RHT3_PHACN